MAFTIKSLEMISTLPKLSKVISFGYPIILLHPDKVQNLFKIDLNKSDMISNTFAQRIRKIHGTSQQYFVETSCFFKKLGATFIAIDIIRSYNCEFLHDLNEDFTDRQMAELGLNDLAIDPGTLEHIFHAGKAFISLYNLCRPGGHILHISAPIAPNHGLWNPQEKLFLRFYMANKAEIICAEKWWTDNLQSEPFTGKRWKLNKACELRSTVLARKNIQCGEVVLPKDYLT